MENIVKYLKEIEENIVYYRRYIHENAEIGFDLEKTYNFVYDTLKSLGYNPYKCGKCGIVATIGSGSRCILLRADMDALNIEEKTSLDFKAKRYMHACGHDMHTAMLLGAAHLFKKYESILNGVVKLVFQPAEEILMGAIDMISNKVLENPPVSCALSLHTLVSTNINSGEIIVPRGKIIAPSSDFFDIEIKGEAVHSGGAIEIDPIMISTYIIKALENLKTKWKNISLSITSLIAGSTYNQIPEALVMKGSLRCFDEDDRGKIKLRMCQIVEYITKAFNTSGNVNFISECPSFLCDEKLSDKSFNCLKAYFKNRVHKVDVNTDTSSSGSEDFAYYTKYVPSVMINISAGSKKEGYNAGLHNNKMIMNEDVLIDGTLAYFLCGIGLLGD